MPKFAANLTLLFNEVDFLERFATARAHGFEAVEFLFPYAYRREDLAARLAASGLTLALHNLPAGDWAAGQRGMACDPARVDEFHASVELARDYALALGVKRLHCLSGLLPAGVTHQQAHATLVANLRHAAARLAGDGIDLLIEPINTFDMPGYFLTGSAQAAALIAECDAGNLFMQFDMYHLQRMEGGLEASLRRYLPLIRHIQIADTPGRHEPGSGEIDYRHLLPLLDTLGYDGWVGCEYFPAGDTIAGLGWREALLA